MLLAYGSGGFDRRGIPEDGDDLASDLEDEIFDPTFVNDGVLEVTDGLLVIEDGYTQESTAVMSIGVEGAEPITDHDLIVVRGEASLAGRLELMIEGARATGGFLAVILVADSIDGDFDEIVPVGTRRQVEVCTTSHAVIVSVGDHPSVPSIEDLPALPAEVIGLIDSIGTTDPAWDLDGDGQVTTTDLRILLDSGRTCP
jgi:hypothetical protein